MILFASGGLADPTAGGSMTTAALVLAGLLTLSFLFSGTETAFFSLQKVDLKRFDDGTPTGARVLRLLENRASLITTILLGNETVNVAIAAVAAGLVGRLVADPDSREWVTVAAVTPVLVLFSEITPKVLAFRFNTTWSRAAAWPISALRWLVTPLRMLISAGVAQLARLAGVPRGGASPTLAEEEFLVLLKEGAASGHVDQLKREFIEAVFEFDDITVDRLMTPRPDVFSVPVEMPWTELITACRDAGYSRVPVYRRNPDDLIGVLLVKDLLRFRKAPPTGPEAIEELLIAPVFIPTSVQADDMLREFLAKKNHLAFVVDEHGTMVGVVTLDDLTRELVGELGEPDEETAEIERSEDGMRVRASMDIEEFTLETGIPVPEGSYHTLGGFVLHHLGHMPVQGEAVELEGRRFEVAEMDGRRPVWIQVEDLPEPTSEMAP